MDRTSTFLSTSSSLGFLGCAELPSSSLLWRSLSWSSCFHLSFPGIFVLFGILVYAEFPSTTLLRLSLLVIVDLTSTFLGTIFFFS